MDTKEYLDYAGLNLFKSLADASYVTRDELHDNNDELVISLGENDFMTPNDVDSMFAAAFNNVYAADDANFMTPGEVDSLFGGGD